MGDAAGHHLSAYSHPARPDVNSPYLGSLLSFLYEHVRALYADHGDDHQLGRGALSRRLHERKLRHPASGMANLIAGLLVTREASDRLAGYPLVGWLATSAFVLTLVLAWRLRAVAPHAAKPGHPGGIAMAVVAD